MMLVPNEIKRQLEELSTNDDPLENLRSLHVIREWAAESELAMIELAQAGGESFQRIGEVLGKPRQAVHRTLKRSQSEGLTHSDFDGVSSSTLRYWLTWWSDPRRRPQGAEEKGRDPKVEAEKVRTELEARRAAGVITKPIEESW
jgi:hypothetical protein